MPKEKMRDMIILLPGIMGSVLQKDNKDIWAPSGQAIWSVIKSLGDSTEQLKLEYDDLDVDELEDGIIASRLIPDVCIVPGLIKIDGYTGISGMIKDRFEIKVGNANDDSPANYFEFPFDWRRDCRVAARKLKKLIDRKLPQWRDYTRKQDAKVILLGHSMGGIVSRYYLENLHGWENCKALISFGTPYRGSLNAVNFLANGYKMMFLNFTEIVRSLTGVYQLLPIYKSIDVDGEFKRVAEIEEVAGINSSMVHEALKFHREIEDAVKGHLKDANYLKNRYKILPMVGINQPTFQSAILTGGKITVSKNLPSFMESGLTDGDGTVPMLSAIPIEISDEYRDSFYSERHASLQNNQQVLMYIYNHLKRMQTNLTDYRGSQKNADIAGLPAISVDLDDLYTTSEPVIVKGNLVNTNSAGEMKATIESANSGNFRQEYIFTEDSNGFLLNVEGLSAGTYRIKIEALRTTEFLPPVHDIFEAM